MRGIGIVTQRGGVVNFFKKKGGLEQRGDRQEV